MASDLEIARAARLCPIAEIAASAGIPAEALESYGRYKAKVGLDFIHAQEGRPDGKLVLILQPGFIRIPSGPPVPMRAPGPLLVSAAPRGPVQHGFGPGGS